MSEKFIRTRRLLGDTAMDKLKNARVAVFGVGGVGGYVVEALVRSGIGEIDIFDNDTVAESNINRQIIATTETIGRLKVDVAKERALLINPDIKVNSHNCFYMPDNADNYNLAEYSYIVDAIDTVTAKIELIKRAKALDVPIISSMGTGNKLDASMLEVTDIKKTEMCPLARTMRRELKNRGITSLKVVYSKEKPIVPDDGERTPASVAFVPAAAGLIIAGEVVKDLTEG
ncbi:MAG: tRNA threonylcarbamoyladenosine dehydratase [Clostridia bacterium]|nr:tRNA threonylcarbamoyladenosine dehydratase [Clostridia bacterium]